MPASPAVHEVQRVRDVRIRVRDGIELSANLWLPVPEAGGASRFPAILELIPYRKDDWRANADEARGRYLAGRGYGFCRVDVRGTGRSGGIADDEYTEAETLDGYELVEWLAAQPWSSGAVGMWGISYGGFTAIQVAALRPPHLRAIVPIYATDDRYTDDVHYIGGAKTASELSQYAVAQVATNALPPLPAPAGEDWRAAWRERLERTPVWLLRWLRERDDGPYWRRGSLAPDWSRIEAPMLLIGGWMDGYVTSPLRMLERCTAPRRAIVGNWVHEFPDEGYPGPNLDWLHEMVRFFDHWLKGVDDGVMDEPALTWFERTWAAPEPFPATWPGRWRAAAAPPLHGTGRATLWLTTGDRPLHGRLAADPPLAAGVATFPHRATVGTRAGLSWGAGSVPNGLARDLRPDESLVPVFETEPLAAPLAILGEVVAEVAVSASMSSAILVARLSAVAPDGTPIQVAAGILDLAHRHGHDRSEPLVPGRIERVRIALRAAGFRFEPGQRVRLSLASSAWPVVFPSPLPGSITVHLGTDAAVASRLILPLAPDPALDLPVPAFRTAMPELDTVGSGRDDPPTWSVTEDVLAGTVTVVMFDGGESTLEDGDSLAGSEGHRFVVSDADPATAIMASEVRTRLRRAGHEIVVEVDSTTIGSVEAFSCAGEIRVDLDGERFFDRTWSEAFPRTGRS